MSEPIKVGDLMDQTPEYRKLLKLKRPKLERVPWPEPTESLAVRGAPPDSQAWEALRLYRTGLSVAEVAAKLGRDEQETRMLLLSAMRVRR